MAIDRPTEMGEQPQGKKPARKDSLAPKSEAFRADEGRESPTLEEVRAATSSIKDSMARVVIEEERAERF